MLTASNLSACGIKDLLAAVYIYIVYIYISYMHH